MKVFLVFVGIFLLGFLLLAGTGFYLWSKYGDEYMQVFQGSAEQGLSAAERDDAACYEGMLVRLTDCNELKCMMDAKIFASSCFRAVKHQTDLCDQVPSVLDFSDYLAWVNQTCERVAPDNSGCNNVLQEVAEYCATAS